MLPRSSHTSRTSTVLGPESISPLQEYLPNLQSPSASTFPEINTDHGGGNEKDSASQAETGTSKEPDSSDFAHLLPQNDFGELFDRFFVAGHKQLRILQSQIQKHDNTFLSLTDPSTQKIQQLRKHYYQLQMVTFRSPKGRKQDIAI